MQIVERIAEFHAELSALRRDLHAHPELRFEELRTSELVASRLAEWGIPAHRGIGGTGVVGVVEGTGQASTGTGSRRPAIGLRADMDALPITERNTFPHASKHPGRMHACGHDGHVAMLLGAARHLARHRDFDGIVYLIFQPAEEGGGGAREMIRDGLFERFPMDAVFGLHNWPGLPAGEFAVRAGPVMGSSNEFRITVRGRGAHAAMPHEGADPVPVACQIVQGLQTIITRNKRPVDSAVLSVTMIQAGEATNIVPDTATIQGTVRTFTTEAIDLIERRMREIAAHTARAFDCEARTDFVRSYPPTINHAAEAAFCRDVLHELVGADRVHEFEPTMGAEDFAYFLQEKPGCYLVIGNGEGTHRMSGHGDGPCTLHNPNYDFNDEILPVGAAYWVRLAERWFAASRANN
ncbi:MAG TPA: M20 aminoacylase family protein [Zeimonas sp.]|nr:M20 aminoacylase family protein [Zeimonas sp.]